MTATQRWSFIAAAPDGLGAARDTVAAALHLLGGALVDEADAPRGIITSFGALSSMSSGALERLRRRSPAAPLLIFAADDTPISAAGLAAVRVLTGTALELTGGHDEREHRFSGDPSLWPFCGLTLREQSTRPPHAVRLARNVEPLLSTPRGGTFVRLGGGQRTTFVSLAGVAHGWSGARLKDGFCSACFAGLLPILVFARAALGTDAWRRTPRATFIVDDANLRACRYGYLDYAALVEASAREDFHTALAMIPIDAAKTRRRPAALVRAHERHLSLVMHGVHHSRHEFDQPIASDQARRRLREGIACMDRHRSRTGIACPRVMTFPFGLCNETWMSAMREVGLAAAVASRAFPFRDEASISEPLHEMYPSESTFRGFPMITRYKAEMPKTDLLFGAWLGKPLIVYTHHEFFEEGLDRLVDIVRLLNRQVEPVWQDVGAIVEGNYQVRDDGRQLVVRAFSNAIKVPLEPGSRRVVTVIKPGGDVPADERGVLGGRALELRDADGEGLLARSVEGVSGPILIAFGPAPSAHEPGRPGAAPIAVRGRRLLTETRDQATPLLKPMIARR